MTHVNRIFAAVAIAATAVALSSCASKEGFSGKDEGDSGSSKGPRIVEATPVVDGTKVVEEGSGLDRSSIADDRLIFFEYDKSAVADKYLPVIQAHVEYLINNRNSRIVLQGHADERGSTEYNLALGQRRADAVRETMEAAGAFSDQLSTISYGEERPRALGSNEAAWAENRRVEIVYSNE